MRRARAGAVLAAAVMVAGAIGAAGTAHADPVYPGKDDVRRAQQRERDAADSVDGIQAQLDASARRVQAADDAVSIAAEDYDAAQVELDDAKKAATTATAAAQRATRRLDGAQRQVGRLAAQSYRDGGQVANLDVLLSPAGPDAVLERATMMQQLATGRQRTVHKMDAARVTATALDRQAALAVTRQKAAARRMAAAKAAAESRANAAHAVEAQQERTRGHLLAQLAKARRTTVAVEKARQAGLAAEAERRREEAARRAAEREAARQRRSSGSSGGSSGGSSSGSSSSSGGWSSGGASSGSSSAGQAAVQWARNRIGLPYLWGGDGPGSYDCSGLTQGAWNAQGVALVHSSRMQYDEVEHIGYGQLRPGDLIFYATNIDNSGTIHHVAIYSGGGMMVEAPHTGANVREVPVRRVGSMPYAGRP